MANHFATKGGTVTDAKIMFKNERSRKFGFVGFKNEEQAEAAQKYFNKTKFTKSSDLLLNDKGKNNV